MKTSSLTTLLFSSLILLTLHACANQTPSATVQNELARKKAFLAPSNPDPEHVEHFGQLGGNPEDILKLYPAGKMLPRLAQYKYRMTPWGMEAPNNSFVMLFFTDLHSSSRDLRRIVTFYNYYEDYFDTIVSGGDALHYWELDYEFWKNDGASKILPVLGNHEVFTENKVNSSVDGVKLTPWVSPAFSQRETFERIFKPYLEDTKIMIEDGKCYWYKDFPAYNIRVFGMDSFHWKEQVSRVDGTMVDKYADGESVDKGEQEQWFKAALEDARAKQYSVICVNHCGFRDNVEVFDCPFTSIYRPGLPKGLKAGMVEAVDEFIANGGQFVAWLCGHSHFDQLGVINSSHSRQLQLVLDKANCSPGESVKLAGTVYDDCFNVIAVDPLVGFITIQRVGGDYDTYGRHIGTLVYDYKNQKIVSHD